MPLVTLTQVAKVGERCFHYFKDSLSGEVVRVPCTDQEYDALALPNAPQPQHKDGFTWVHSCREIKYDTPDGDLPEDAYFTLESGKHIVRLAGKKPFELVEAKADDIVGNQADIIYGDSI